MQRLPAHVEDWHYKGVTVFGADIPLTAEDIGDHVREHFYVEAIHSGDPSVIEPIGFRIKNPVGLLAIEPTLNGLAQLAVRSGKEPSVVFELFTRLLISEKLNIGSTGLARRILAALQETFGIHEDSEELYFQVSYILQLLKRLDDRLRVIPLAAVA